MNSSTEGMELLWLWNLLPDKSWQWWSLPDFNPETIEKDWPSMMEDENSPVFSKGNTGLYPPGSTYKIVTAAGVYDNGMTTETLTMKDYLKRRRNSI